MGRREEIDRRREEERELKRKERDDERDPRRQLHQVDRLQVQHHLAGGPTGLAATMRLGGLLQREDLGDRRPERTLFDELGDRDQVVARGIHEHPDRTHPQLLGLGDLGLLGLSRRALLLSSLLSSSWLSGSLC